MTTACRALPLHPACHLDSSVFQALTLYLKTAFDSEARKDHPRNLQKKLCVREPNGWASAALLDRRAVFSHHGRGVPGGASRPKEKNHDESHASISHYSPASDRVCGGIPERADLLGNLQLQLALRRGQSWGGDVSYLVHRAVKNPSGASTGLRPLWLSHFRVCTGCARPKGELLIRGSHLLNQR